VTFDHATLAVRAFEAPWDHDVVESLRVCADALEARGEPRGSLMSLCFAPPSREVRLAIEEVGKRVLGELGPIGAAKRGLRVAWRAGALYAAQVDTRHVEAPPLEIIRGLFSTSEIRTLRHLWIRSTPAQVSGLVEAIGDHHARPPLERLSIGTDARPALSRYRTTRPYQGMLLRAYPNLHLLGNGEVIDLEPTTPETLGARASAIAAIATVDVDARRILGRGLLSETLRATALATIARLGVRATAFVDLLGYLLQPRVIPDPVLVIACVAQLGTVAREIWPLVGAITGRPELYSQEVRKRAGMVYRDLR